MSALPLWRPAGAVPVPRRCTPVAVVRPRPPDWHWLSLSVNLLIVAAAGTIALFLARRPGWLKLQRYLMGTVLGALALRLAAERSPSHA
jgi:hypothetical protein